jgi:hypothetical protein
VHDESWTFDPSGDDRSGCKGITVYRYGTRPGQVLQRIPTDVESLSTGHAEP